MWSLSLYFSVLLTVNGQLLTKMAESLELQQVNLKETKIESAEELANLTNAAESPPNSEAADSAIGKSSQDVSSEDEQSVIPDVSRSDESLVESKRVVDLGDQVGATKISRSCDGVRLRSCSDLRRRPSFLRRNVSQDTDLEGGITNQTKPIISQMTYEELDKYYDSKITYITDQGM